MTAVCMVLGADRWFDMAHAQESAVPSDKHPFVWNTVYPSDFKRGITSPSHSLNLRLPFVRFDALVTHHNLGRGLPMPECQAGVLLRRDCQSLNLDF